MFDFKLTSIGILIECTLDCVNMAKVKFASNQEHEFINNWKILQKAFKNAGVDKVKFILPFFFFWILYYSMMLIHFTLIFDMYLVL